MGAQAVARTVLGRPHRRRHRRVPSAIRRLPRRLPKRSPAMTSIGQAERATQNRVVALFRDELGWRYLGDWSDREGNTNIEESLLSPWLQKRGATPAQISAALLRLRTEAG